MSDIRPDVGSKPPSWAGDIVSMTICKDVLYVACQRGVFTLGEFGFVPVPILSIEESDRLRIEARERKEYMAAMLEKIDA